MTRTTAVAALGALLALACWACQPASPCDPDQASVGSLCYAIVKTPDAGDAGADAGTDAGGDAGPDAGAVCTAPDGGFGAYCTALEQCPCGLDFCVAFSGFDYCTRKGCLADPSICPAGWVCTDLSAYGQPSVCFKP